MTTLERSARDTPEAAPRKDVSVFSPLGGVALASEDEFLVQALDAWALIEAKVRDQEAEIARLRAVLAEIVKMPERRSHTLSPQGVARLALWEPQEASKPVRRCNCPESGTSGSCPFHDNSTLVPQGVGDGR